ncbi:hypothetical protein UY3_03742 [Chelonia mydas]|uniref:Uncharacterized protein n=1 Tax=Chelonia mydas TaxID=8469 RepID=M7C3L7_CHEMY|nr:hypothetical protein UY3_03742 [Chelonia mydas]
MSSPEQGKWAIRNNNNAALNGRWVCSAGRQSFRLLPEEKGEVERVERYPNIEQKKPEGWVLVRGKRGARKLRARSLPSDEEGDKAPRKMLRGADAVTTSVVSPDGAQQGTLAMAADGGITAPLVESPPKEASVGVLLAPLPSVPPAVVDTGAITALAPDGEDSGAVGTGFTSIFEEIEALGLTPVTQGEDDPQSEGLDLDGGSVPPPPPPSPCPSLPTVAPALVLGCPWLSLFVRPRMAPHLRPPSP